MNWNFTYYNERIQREIFLLPNKICAKYLALMERMIVDGPDIGMPYTRAMGKGLFEIRLRAETGIARVFYCTIKNKNIVMLHSFTKKTQQIPKKELDIAINRMKEVKNYADS